ncbi:MAG TPA: L,D-transpeptidase [Candidatus Acidoferrales bacterium]|nr:L,D-transpeptidase [Candidatus Acidoferrales bacterium]
MRLLPLAAAGVTLAVVAGAASISVVGASRQSAFASRASSLQHVWDADVAAGVPDASIAPLRHTLQSSNYQAAWWSPTWWTNTGSALLDDLQQRTDAAWNAAIAGARAGAQTSLDNWAQLVQQLGPFIPSAAASDAATWPSALQTATTPSAIKRLAGLWSTEVGIARHDAQTAQINAQINAELAGAGGVSGLLAQAKSVVVTTQQDNLDAGQLPALISALQDELRGGADPTQTADQMVTEVKSVQALIALNNDVSAGLRPLLLLVDQAGAEGTPNGHSFVSQYSTVASSLHDATNTAQLNAVQSQMSSMQSSVNQELSTNQCGHNVGSGKVITVNLTLQEAVFYQDGCEVQATPVTTGRALLRTPTGTFHVFTRASPFQFISPWPKTSPFYYYPSWVSWVMEFASGGYFLHDAPWEPNWQYGPGSEDSSGASHGCIHIPTPVMKWAYTWTPNGTPVLISY